MMNSKAKEEVLIWPSSTMKKQRYTSNSYPYLEKYEYEQIQFPRLTFDCIFEIFL